MVFRGIAMDLVRDTNVYSTEFGIAKAKGRTREARFLNTTRALLTAHVGNPNALQSLLIERACWALLRLEQMDQENLRHGTSQDHADYLGLLDSATSLLARLGMTPADIAPPNTPEAA